MRKKINVYAIKEKKEGIFKNPFYADNYIKALKYFHDFLIEEMESVDKEYAKKHIKSFDLYRLGSFFPDTGFFEEKVPEYICNGLELVEEVSF